MCGIAGIVASDANRYQAALERMVAALSHRGPDGDGRHLFDACALGHRRLTIVDLATGDQPMLTPDGQVAITFNGEIYGFREIRRKLDYEFHTTSDTEVILALYRQHGRDLLRHLPGMFAFALWDERELSLLAARDRFGEKPFFYAWGENGEFLFASEIKSLLAAGLFRPKLDKESLAHYLRHLYVHPHRTIYSNVFALPPAHQLYLKHGRISVEPYWQLPATREPLSEQEAEAEFKRLFERAVEQQLVADVPVGAFLSGGVDSSSVVAAASRFHPRIQTFSFGFRDSPNNELPYAREIAELYDTGHIELEDQCIDIADLLREMARIYDEPFADSSNIPTYLISQAARRYSKVVLTGDGGDELLAGYDYWYRPLWHIEHNAALAAHAPGSNGGGGAPSLMRLAGRVASRFGLKNGGGEARRHDDNNGAPSNERLQRVARAHLDHNIFFNPAEVQQLGLQDYSAPRTLDAGGTFDGTVNDALRMDLLDYMPGDILVKTDRASMAHGLELRAPFLDVELASFCISLPSRLKITEREDKWILRRCYGEAWTEAVRTRRKAGFGAPVEQWLKRASVRALKEKILHNPRHSLFQLIPFDASRAVATGDNYQTWILLTLGLWLEHGGEESL